MFDKSVSIRMTSCHDPYRELELYLEQAQEEIGKAIKELEWHEECILADEKLEPDPNDSISSLLPPPEAFRSTNSREKFDSHTQWINNSSTSTVNRLCHGGNIVHIKTPSDKPSSFDQPNSSSTPFLSSLNPGSLGRCRKATYSPNTRRRLWQMHPSISFPETSKDLLLLGKDSDISCYSQCNGSVINRCLPDSFDHTSKSLTLNSQNCRTRRRSSSESSEQNVHFDNSVDNLVIPRPPSGDVNLLSVWANNLVLELDKTLNEELFSTSSVSPSSDYSLSPTKVDDALESSNDAVLNLDAFHASRAESVDVSRISSLERNLKLTSMSPDSGIEHFSCATPDMIDEISPSSLRCQTDARNCDLITPNSDPIPSPPPEFGDEASEFQEDKVKCNTSKLVSTFLKENNLNSLN